MHRYRFFLLGVLLAGMVVWAQNRGQTVQAAAYYSFTGALTDGTETQSFHFNLSTNISSSTDPFSLRTWHYGGGTNAAGDFIDAGGFDPVLKLYDPTPTQIVMNDDINTGGGELDSLINWVTPGMPPSLPADDYRLDLEAFNGTLGGRLPHWAVDLVGPVDVMSLTGVSSIPGTGASTISSLKFGTNTRGAATVQIDAGQSLEIANDLVVGKTGTGVLSSSGGSIVSGTAWLGYDSGSSGTVMLSNGAQWTANTVQLGHWDTGDMNIESASWAEFNGDAYMAWYYTADSEVTVSGLNSRWIVHGDLEVGDGGTGLLGITNQGQVDSTGVGSMARDVVGDDASAHGVVQIDGSGSLWQTDTLVVGNSGQGTLNISNGGKIATTGNAYLSWNAGGDPSSATISGIAADQTQSEWLVTGSLYVGGSDTAAGGTATVTVEDQGLLNVGSDTLIYGGGQVNVSGINSHWQTGAVVVGASGAGTGQVILSDQAIIDSGLLMIAPTSYSGTVVVNGYTSGPGYRATWNVNGDLTLGLGNANLTIEQSGRMNVSGSAQIRATTPSSSYLIVQSQGELNIGGSCSMEDGGIIELLGGSITTGSFIRQGGVFTHEDGTLTVDGGTFVPGTPGYTIDGAQASDLPTIKLVNNASANLSDTLNVGNINKGALEIRSGSTLTCPSALIGVEATSTGGSSVTVTGTGSTWTITNSLDLKVGCEGKGSLMVSDGGYVEITDSNGYGYIGTFNEGEVIVEGKGSRISSIHGFTIGLNGTGVLRILNGGLVSDTGSSVEMIGWYLPSQGTVEVSGTAPDGTQSTWSSVGDICVGRQGLGILSITQGALVQCPEGRIADYSGSAGSSATVSGKASNGTPSEWSIASSLYVGGGVSTAGDTGTLTVAAGGLVNVGDTLKIWPTGTVELLGSSINCHSFDNSASGTFTHEDGTLTVDGGTFNPGTPGYTIDGAEASDLPTIKLVSNASANLSDSLVVGQTYRGALEIHSGSTFTCPNAIIGGGVTSTGGSSVTVTGTDSTWTLTGILECLSVGFQGKGSLMVSDGGHVELTNPAGVCDIGVIDGEGEVVVEGKGSRITSINSLVIGSNGTGVLRILSGGLVYDTGSFVDAIGVQVGYQGTVEVSGTALDGTQSTWSSAGPIWIGNSGLGTLSVTQGALVQCLEGLIALGPSAAGSSATVSGKAPDGTPSEWSVTGWLYVGGNYTAAGGTGTLTIENGGLVNVGDTLKVWPTGAIAYQEGNIAAAQIALGGLFTGFGTLNAPLTSEHGSLETPSPSDLLVLNSPLEIAGSMSLLKLGSGTVQLHGTQIWRNGSFFEVQEGLVEYDVSAPTVVEPFATLNILNGATVNAGGMEDPFTDALDPSLHVDVFNLGDFKVTQGEKTVGFLLGNGNTFVAGGAVLTAGSIVQNNLTIGAGAKVKISPSTGAGLSGSNPVPEPSIFILLGIGVLGLLVYVWRRRK